MGRQSRRNFILGSLGVIGIGGAGLWFGRNAILRGLIPRLFSNDVSKATAAPGVGEDLCVLTAKQTEGPFFIASPLRSDIREDRKGKQLDLELQVMDAEKCTPLEGAVVEVWHCDAEGGYSGYPEEYAHDPFSTMMYVGKGDTHVEPVNEKRFLRGAQRTDADGIAKFTTIVPGWYEPRTPHIHFKVLFEDKAQLTSQFYFDEAFTNGVFTSTEPYTKFGKSPYSIANDPVVNNFPDATALLLKPEATTDGPLSAAVKIGIKRV